MYQPSFPNFYFICPLTCTPLYIRNDLVKTLVIPQSLKIVLFRPISLRVMAKIFCWRGLRMTYPVTSSLNRGSHPSFCLTHTDLSALHSCPTPTIGPLHVLFSPTGTFFPPPPGPVNIFSSFTVIHPILLSNSSLGLPDHVKSPLARYPLLWGTYCILL